MQGAVAHSWVHCRWSYSWVGRLSGLIILTYLQRFYFLDMGRGEPKNHLAEQFAISLHWLFHLRLPQSDNSFVMDLGKGKGQLPILLDNSFSDNVSGICNTDSSCLLCIPLSCQVEYKRVLHDLRIPLPNSIRQAWTNVYVCVSVCSQYRTVKVCKN